MMCIWSRINGNITSMDRYRVVDRQCILFKLDMPLYIFTHNLARKFLFYEAYEKSQLNRFGFTFPHMPFGYSWIYRFSQSLVLRNLYVIRVLLFQFFGMLKIWILWRSRRRLITSPRKQMMAVYQLMRWLGERLPYQMVVSMEVFLVLPSSTLLRFVPLLSFNMLVFSKV